MSEFLRSIGALYATDYIRRTKECAYCGTQFCDVTKRNLRHTCTDKCDSAMMVAKRRANGSYNTTEEQNKKRSLTMREAYASGRIVTSEELRQKLSETMKRTWREGRIDTSKHWTKTQEGRQRLSEASTGRKHSVSTRVCMSIAAQNRLRTKRETLYTSAHGGIREDIGVYFRSAWEANFARVLTFQKKTWTYESRTFQLEPSLSYTPDFFVEEDNVYYEIKGRWTEKAHNQLHLMKEKFPDITVQIIDGAKYRQLKVEYRDKVRWEGK